MKILPKSQRESSRYISFIIQSDKKITTQSFAAALQAALIKLVGVIGQAYARPNVVQFVYPTGVIQTNPKGVDIVKATLATITLIDSNPVVVKSTATSGMIHNVKTCTKTK